MEKASAADYHGRLKHPGAGRTTYHGCRDGACGEFAYADALVAPPGDGTGGREWTLVAGVMRHERSEVKPLERFNQPATWSRDFKRLNRSLGRLMRGHRVHRMRAWDDTSSGYYGGKTWFHILTDAKMPERFYDGGVSSRGKACSSEVCARRIGYVGLEIRYENERSGRMIVVPAGTVAPRWTLFRAKLPRLRFPRDLVRDVLASIRELKDLDLMREQTIVVRLHLLDPDFKLLVMYEDKPGRVIGACQRWLARPPGF